MTIKVFWQLPVHGDGAAISPELWTRGDYAAGRKEPHPYARTGRPRDGYTYFDYLAAVAGAAELARFDGAWIGLTADGEDPLVTAGAFVREARHLKFAPQLHAPLLSAVYAAKIANSYQRLSGGRLAWHLVTQPEKEGTQRQRPWHGRHWSEAEQVARTAEFLDVAKGFWFQPPFTYHGQYFEVENGGFAPALQGQPFPEVYLGGDSDAALELSARHADVHFLPLLPPAELVPRIARLDALAASHGRKLRYALAADVLARDEADTAWQALRTRWEDAAAVAEQSLPPFDQLRTGPNLWNGFGLTDPHAGAGLVGSYDEIVARVREYVALGIDSFVFNAHPALEEAVRLGERLLPRLRLLDGEQQLNAA
ncbi:LLM class flavin-dependent oxidoreductase [Pseudoduganella umbonata]|uniref:Alkanesulfonate monooxygenase n=1 Tax=Pseudoduganella umbonata TaxID=864828 RepID=A0A4P8HVL7_9BURK|nr:LLM class flavin-dependent oxidoreductase [Pseudoduganella umbonata]MBB3224017.1 alkanesulfonate monooxygenase [Pseudoduganella umbonata]QCP14107.1 LLM class flavin-dependent oxidoreductase [Pseudoduganella umbonata]